MKRGQSICIIHFFTPLTLLLLPWKSYSPFHQGNSRPNQRFSSLTELFWEEKESLFLVVVIIIIIFTYDNLYCNSLTPSLPYDRMPHTSTPKINILKKVTPYCNTLKKVTPLWKYPKKATWSTAMAQSVETTTILNVQPFWMLLEMNILRCF